MKKSNVNRMLKAAALIKQAQELIKVVAQDETWATGRCDCNHFANEIEELLNADNGLAGFNAYINIIKK